jgi:hypothetical protein
LPLGDVRPGALRRAPEWIDVRASERQVSGEGVNCDGGGVAAPTAPGGIVEQSGGGMAIAGAAGLELEAPQGKKGEMVVWGKTGDGDCEESAGLRGGEHGERSDKGSRPGVTEESCKHGRRETGHAAEEAGTARGDECARQGLWREAGGIEGKRGTSRKEVEEHVGVGWEQGRTVQRKNKASSGVAGTEGGKRVEKLTGR